MQVLFFAFPRKLTLHALVAAGTLALASILNPVAAQTPTPEKKPAVQGPAPEKKVTGEAVPADNGAKPLPTLVSVKAGADEVTHLVKKGDTLWDLAKAYLQDPFRWPDVFLRNTDIVENPHWIYPGDHPHSIERSEAGRSGAHRNEAGTTVRSHRVLSRENGPDARPDWIDRRSARTRVQLRSSEG